MAPELPRSPISLTQWNVGGDYLDGHCIWGGKERGRLGEPNLHPILCRRMSDLCPGLFMGAVNSQSVVFIIVTQI